MSINNISVFCGSSTGWSDIYMSQAYQLGKEIADRGKNIVYGGAHVGLMGAVASGALDNGAEVYGVMPNFLKQKEWEYERLTHMYIVETMHERKAKMNELSDAIIALPGGFGTMEELFEMMTWAQLALHKKPIGLLNVNNFYDPLLSFVEKMIDEGFVKKEYRELFVVDSNPTSLLDKLDAYQPLTNDKWFKPQDCERVKIYNE